MAGVQTVTARLAKAGHPEVTLWRGEGYHYFEFWDGDKLDTETVMTMHFRDMSADRWVEAGIEFAQKTKGAI